MTDNINMFNRVKHFVDQKYEDANVAEIQHFIRTVYWLEKLRPSADKALIIAAYSHDIELAVRYETAKQTGKEFVTAVDNEDVLTQHQVQGGQIMKDFLLQSGATSELAERVNYLISKHEVGGDDDQNVLKDADSISFLETIAPGFAKRWLPAKGKEFVTKKFKWMYDRISSPVAKELATPFYDQAMRLITL